jgi:chemotaxis protein methyltransferase CheR
MYNQNTASPISGNEFSNVKLKNETVLSEKSFDDWRQYIYNLCGIYFQDNKKYLLESRLQKRMNHIGIDCYDKYLEYLKVGAQKANEQKYLFEAITINETYFFRNQPQLDALVSNIIPEIVSFKSRFNNYKIRIWSAASSSGEEAYSIAIVLNELIKPKYPKVEFEIVGTDINQAVLETARSGIYRDYSVRNAPAFYLKKYFKTNNGYFEVDTNLKKYVNFKVVNLFDDLTMKTMNNFDIIFCANVLIYFDVRSKMKVISKLYDSLNKGGYLFIGYSETLHGISKAFKLVSYPKTIGYMKE